MATTENIDWTRSKYPLFNHQKDGVEALIKSRVFGLLDEMGAGKSLQVIYAACLLYESHEIDTVLIICPAQVKDVWCHTEYSQIVEHSFVPGVIYEFTSKSVRLPDSSEGLSWVVTSVELLRNPTHVHTLLKLLNKRRLWIIVDESSTISNPRASQTKGVMALRQRAIRRTILNGTPVGNSPLTLYSQFYFLDPMILGFRNYFAFRNYHAKMGGYQNKQVIGFYNLEELQTKIKPFVLRRLKKDCLDILPKLRAPIIEVRLTPATWQKYRMMRDEFVAYIDGHSQTSVVTTAPIKALRLAQLCSGFLGGVETEDSETKTVEISSELTDVYLYNLERRLLEEPDFKLITWCRFRAEIARLEQRARERFPHLLVRVLQGGLSRADRKEAITLFHPDAPDIEGPALLIGQPQAGRFGLNFTKCSNVDYLSNDYSFLTRSQSEDRIHRPGQKFQAYFQDYIVVGPNREKTISGVIYKALNAKEDMATWTCSKWRSELVEEN
jgi:SNF2 family DNA or RNA helicase